MSYSWEEGLEQHISDLFQIHNIDAKAGWEAVRRMAYENWEQLTINGGPFIQPVESLQDEAAAARCNKASPNGLPCGLPKGHAGKHYRNPKVTWDDYIEIDRRPENADWDEYYDPKYGWQ